MHYVCLCPNCNVNVEDDTRSSSGSHSSSAELAAILLEPAGTSMAGLFSTTPENQELRLRDFIGALTPVIGIVAIVVIIILAVKFVTRRSTTELTAAVPDTGV